MKLRNSKKIEQKETENGRKKGNQKVNPESLTSNELRETGNNDEKIIKQITKYFPDM